MNIDAKINGACIVMGLLYGEGDPDRTLVISMRCGQDSDCHPSNAAGILFTTIGFSKLPKRYISALDTNRKFGHTPYNFSQLIAVCEKLARQVIVRSGGVVEMKGSREVFVIPVKKAKLSKFERSWNPGPIENSKFTEQEMAQIDTPAQDDLAVAVDRFAPGWNIENCGDSMEPGLHGILRGKKGLLVTHPELDKTACILWKNVDIPANKQTLLQLAVSHAPKGDWNLIVRADNKQLLEQPIGEDSVVDGWKELKIDLSEFAGRKVKVELVNQPSGWAGEAAYWGKIQVESR